MRVAVQQDDPGTLEISLHDPITQAAIDLDSATVRILGPLGSEVVSSSAATVSGNTASFSRTFDAATFQRERHYRAEFSLVSSGKTYKRSVYFAVVLRLFVPTLTEAKLIERNPGLSNELPASIDSFAPFRRKAWSRIVTRVQNARPDRDPGDLFYPEGFEDAHEALCLADFYMTTAYDGDPLSENIKKFEYHERRGLEALEAAMSSSLIDRGEDGVVNEKRDLYVDSIRLVR